MKTYKNLFEKFVSFDNLLDAYKKARKGKVYQGYATEFNYNLSGNLLEIRNQLLKESYRFDEYKVFYVYDPKQRLIKAPSFRDRIVHHSLCNIIEPIFDQKFIYDSYACRKEKGTHKAVKRLQGFLRELNIGSRRRASVCSPSGTNERESKIYALAIDISKYFPSVNHRLLFQIIRKKIADPKILNFIKKLLDTSSTENEYDHLFSPDSHFRTKHPRGIPLGNLTSQLFANIYLNEVDQFVKHRLKIKYYLRYMDDSVILSKDKKHLRRIKEEIVKFLYDRLYLTAHPKKIRIFPADKGINFLGYVVFKDHILLRSSNVRKFRKKYRKLLTKVREGKISKEEAWQSIQSWIAHAKQADSYRLRKKLFSTDYSPLERGKGCVTSFLTHPQPPLKRGIMKSKISEEAKNSLSTRPASGQLRLFE